LSTIASQTPAAEPPAAGLVEKTTTVEVNGKRFEVRAWVPESGGVAASGRRTPRASAAASNAVATGDVIAPMQGTIVKVLVEVGQEVKPGDAVVVLEAMKMEQPIMAPKDGTVESVGVNVGDSITGGHIIAVVS
jgi:acetyl-CoA/propionyl-CoA carboxylase biotin carboxyl carrier protein